MMNQKTISYFQSVTIRKRIFWEDKSHCSKISILTLRGEGDLGFHLSSRAEVTYHGEEQLTMAGNWWGTSTCCISLFYTDVMYPQYKDDVIYVDVYRWEAFREKDKPLQFYNSMNVSDFGWFYGVIYDLNLVYQIRH